MKRATDKPRILVLAALIFAGALSVFIMAKERSSAFRSLYRSSQVYPPVYSTGSGFYKDEIILTLTHESELKIYYTTDGSTPGLNSNLYSSPVIIKSSENNINSISGIPTSPRWKPPINSVFKGTLVRAVAVTADNMMSSEVAHVYFIHPKGRNRYTLPVFSIIADHNDLFGYRNGIYVMGKGYEDKDNYIKDNVKLDAKWWDYPANYNKRGKGWERFAHIDYFDISYNSGFSINAGIRINGNATRAYSQKSLRICFEKEYGEDFLKYKVFQNNHVQHFKRLILRNSGNDWDKTMFRDALSQTLLQNLDMDIQAYTPSVVFINGEYWGIHNIREYLDENYIINKYDISKDSIVILEPYSLIYHGSKGDEEHYLEMLRFVKEHDLSETDNYRKVKTLMNTDNFIDYIIANIYFANTDWPGNNEKFWRKKIPTHMHDSSKADDGRWRWMIMDTDYGFGYTGNPTAYKFNSFEKIQKSPDIGMLFNKLMTNKEFMETFERRFGYHLTYTFSSDSVIKKIDEMQAVLAPEMQEHIKRWRHPGSVGKWKDNVQELRDFALNRPEYMRMHLHEYLK